MLDHLTHLLVIVGCAKCGTSALAQHLAARPRMKMGRTKEPRYFTSMGKTPWAGPASEGFRRNLITKAEDYAANFPDLAKGQWAIDASTDYIWRPEATDLLKDFSRGRTVRLICIVRDPIDRAISEYNHTLRHGWETLPFWDSVEAEAARIRDNWQPLFYHRRRSMVAEDIARLHAAFGDDLMILDYTALHDPETLMQRVQAFLGIPSDPGTTTPVAKANQTFLPRNRLAARLLQSPMATAVGRIVLPSPVRAVVRRFLHADARKLTTVHPAEVDRFRALMQDEIARCRQSPLIPTETWTLATAAS